jgi:hypothetical protein
MFTKDLTKCAAAALVATACIFVMGSATATNFTPTSASCHPSTDRGACLKHAQPATASGVERVALLHSVPNNNPVSSACHPSMDRGACLKR